MRIEMSITLDEKDLSLLELVGLILGEEPLVAPQVGESIDESHDSIEYIPEDEIVEIETEESDEIETDLVEGWKDRGLGTGIRRDGQSWMDWEEQALLYLGNEGDVDWDDIGTKMGRTPVACRVRFNLLMRTQRTEGEVIEEIIPPAAEVVTPLKPSRALRGKGRKGRSKKSRLGPIKKPTIHFLQHNTRGTLLTDKSVKRLIGAGFDTIEAFSAVDTAALVKVLGVHERHTEKLESLQMKGTMMLREYESKLLAKEHKLKKKQVAKEVQIWTEEENSVENLRLLVWNALSAVRPNGAGVVTVHSIIVKAVDLAINQYGEFKEPIDTARLYNVVDEVVYAVFKARDSPDFMIGEDDGKKYLMVLTDATWPARADLQFEA